MVKKEVYEKITNEKLSFYDSRPYLEIFTLVDYLWKEERKDYYCDYPIGIDNHIFLDLVELVKWMKYSTTSEQGKDLYSELLIEKESCDKEVLND